MLYFSFYYIAQFFYLHYYPFQTRNSPKFLNFSFTQDFIVVLLQTNLPRYLVSKLSNFFMFGVFFSETLCFFVIDLPIYVSYSEFIRIHLRFEPLTQVFFYPVGVEQHYPFFLIQFHLLYFYLIFSYFSYLFLRNHFLPYNYIDFWPIILVNFQTLFHKLMITPSKKLTFSTQLKFFF